ncbi:hypothetical protein AWZ03_013605 [Drosophila navojoa]|uniref:Transmembrane protein 17B n=1 Tax=Drosophila navojoa TaxID=7232 RepID=A0A484AU99_DRONA|nr:transmembrane protein 17B-like [Drosophila navojoa]TDG39974.1 hypothetical protein AWZ03_013605 [Drosophila navojoa]
MSHIVKPVHASLLMQMLLDGNLYVAVTWAFSYLLNMFVYEWPRLKLSMVLLYVVTVTIESMRIYMGYVLNLSPKGPHSKLPLALALGACLPMMCLSWYLYDDRAIWMRVIYNVWTFFIVLELIVAAHIIWKRVRNVQLRPDWSAMEANLMARRRRSAHSHHADSFHVPSCTDHL